MCKESQLTETDLVASVSFDPSLNGHQMTSPPFSSLALKGYFDSLDQILKGSVLWQQQSVKSVTHPSECWNMCFLFFPLEGNGKVTPVLHPN